MDWSKVWWACDLSYVLRMYWHSFSQNNMDASEKTISAVFEDIQWTLDRQPSMAFICLDSGKSVRKDLYPAYKAGRPAAEPEFWGCYEGALKCLEGLLDYVHVVSAVGWEADDCMATVAKMAIDAGQKCVLMTQDKDVRQCLVPGQVTTQRRIRGDQGQAEWGWLNCEKAEADWKIPRSKFIDYQILVGDKGDNIPHPDGVGPANAVRLLDQFGSVAHMKTIQHVGKIGQALANFWPMEPTVRQLVTLNNQLNDQGLLKSVLSRDPQPNGAPNVA